jgi:mannose-6-phosphate isomerase-like protein (cupin superfamily)
MQPMRSRNRREDDMGVTEFRRALQVFASSDLYRAARADELVVHGNPFRRPVRPDDLASIDLSTPIAPQSAFSLSSLVTGRLLLNAYESDVDYDYDASPLLADQAAVFYSEANRRRAYEVRANLEHHLFDEVDDHARILVRKLGARSAATEALARCQRTMRTSIMPALRSRANSARDLLAIQAALVYFGGVCREGAVRISGEASASTKLTMFLRSCGLDLEPHSHFQFYLPSSLRLRCFAYRARGPGYGSLRAAGAQYCEDHERRFLAGALASAEECAGLSSAMPTSHFDELAAKALGDRGPEGLDEFARGIVERQILRSLADADYLTQIAWVAQFDTFRTMGRDIRDTIRTERMPVELETYVESSEECSTTHVHETHRLLVIENGEMDFWNGVNIEHRFRAGDCFLVPRHRLHGSVVRSGTCTYHQPIIPAALMRPAQDPDSRIAAELMSSCVESWS